MVENYKVQTRWLFHSNIKLKIPERYDNEVFDKLYEVLEEVNTRYNSYSPDSFITKINNNSGSFVRVDDTTIEILETIKYYSSKLDGEYDVTIMPLIKLWGFYKDKQNVIPSEDEIEAVKKLVNYKNIEINKEAKEVKIAKDQEIITGSFVKSFAVEKLVDKMKEMGIPRAIINAGGSTLRAVNDDIQSTWGVIVENPNDSENDLFDIEICNETFSTSAQTNTYVEINGKKYGHIISPKTGFPSENKQIGIITESGFIGDIISTGLYNQTPERFLQIIEELSKEIKIEGFLMDREDKIYYSRGFENYIEK